MTALTCLKIHTGAYFIAWMTLMLYAAEHEKWFLAIPSMLFFVLSIIGVMAISGAKE